MQNEENCSIIQNHLIDLIKAFNPLRNELIIKNVILLTCLDQTNISDIPFNEKQATYKSTSPVLIVHRHDMDIVNCKKYLFSVPGNEEAAVSCLNFMYFLTYYNNVKIIIAIDQNDILEESSKRFVQILNILEANMSFKSRESEIFFSCIAFAIKETNEKHSISHYTEKLQQVTDTIGLSLETKTLLLKIINKKSIIIHSKALTESEFLEQISKSKICGFETNPKRLTELFKEVLKEEYFKSMATSIFNNKNSYEVQLNELMNKVAKEIYKMDIFSEDPSIRNSITKSILAESSFCHIAKEISFLGNEKESRKVAQFVIQATISTFQALSLKYEEFEQSNKVIPYSQFNRVNQNYIDLTIDQNIENQSFIGIILENLFNEKTPLFDKEVVALSKYFLIFLRLFENFPLANVREIELSIAKKFRETINEYLIDYFIEFLNPTISKLSGESDSYEGKRFLSLIKDTEILIHFMKMSKEAIEAKSEKCSSFVLSFICLSWKCYEKFKGVWPIEKKNDFMLDQLNLCFENLNYLKGEFKSEALKILKEVHKYFGNFLQREKNYVLAIKFYEASNINSKVIECYRLYFAYCMTTTEFKLDDIEEGVLKLAHFGLISESLTWIRKFREKVDDSSLFRTIQEEVESYNKKDSFELFEKFVKLEYNEIKVVDKKCVTLLKNQLKTKDWKETFRESFC